MGGAHVFPGGKISEEDHTTEARERFGSFDARGALGEANLEESFARALFMAAARETLEESGVGPLDPTSLVPLSRWMTPAGETRRFDARFFLAVVPEGQLAQHDAKETTEHLWATPRRALTMDDAAEIQLPPPTRRTLEWLSVFETTDQVIVGARARKPPFVRPLLRLVDDGIELLLPGHPDHPEPTPVIEGSTNIIVRAGKWWAKP